MTQRTLDIPGYELHERLGRGGMAEVYRATQLSLGREVAIKVLLETGDPAFAERFLREARIVASLRHRAIVTIHDIGCLDDGRHYLAMEYLAGGDLAQRKGAAFAPRQALAIVRQLATGLAEVHGHGLVHRDVKPANVLFRDDGSAVLTDFGVAKAVEVDSELTQFGIAVGSPAYSSPEQARCEPLDARSDLYSLGVILIELLTGNNPFRGDNYTGTVLNHIQLAPPPLPPALARYQPLLDGLLAKDRNARFADCAALLAALDALEEPHEPDLDETQLAPAVRLAAQPGRGQHLRPWLAGLLGLLLAVGIGLGARAWYQQMRIDDYLALAEQRLAEGKLRAPAADNADFYFRQALRLDEDNETALEGLRRVLAARIGEALILADQRLADDWLLTPDGDSALHYYRQVLGWAPDHAGALDGLHRIAERMLSESEAAYARREYALALEYIHQGLEIEPQHAALLALRDNHPQRVAEGRQRRVVTRAPASGRSSSKADSAPANPVKQLWNRLFQP